jgi:hypothetical protein
MSNTVFDSEKISVNCPNCTREIRETIEFFRSSPAVTCPACNASIKFDASGFDKGLEDAQRALDKFT